jgi:hypothetical protein
LKLSPAELSPRHILRGDQSLKETPESWIILLDDPDIQTRIGGGDPGQGAGRWDLSGRRAVESGAGITNESRLSSERGGQSRILGAGPIHRRAEIADASDHNRLAQPPRAAPHAIEPHRHLLDRERSGAAGFLERHGVTAAGSAAVTGGGPAVITEFKN